MDIEGVPLGVRHVLGVVFLVVSVAFVHWDAERTKMHHPNFWIVAVAFFPPMLVLYLIRRYQHLSQTKLSKTSGAGAHQNAARAGRG